jgi:hypothetical protein
MEFNPFAGRYSSVFCRESSTVGIPMAARTLQLSDLQAEFKHLRRGQTYEITESFYDYDKNHYPEGLKVVFIGADHSAIDRALSLFFMIGGLKKQIRLHWDDAGQADIIDNLHYIFDDPV